MRTGCSFFYEHPLVGWWRWRESNPRPSVPNQGFSGRSLIWDVSPISHSGKLMMAQSLFDFPPSPATGESGDPPSDARS
jgi:hypothetical protein